MFFLKKKKSRGTKTRKERKKVTKHLWFQVSKQDGQDGPEPGGLLLVSLGECRTTSRVTGSLKEIYYVQSSQHTLRGPCSGNRLHIHRGHPVVPCPNPDAQPCVAPTALTPITSLPLHRRHA